MPVRASQGKLPVKTSPEGSQKVQARAGKMSRVGSSFLGDHATGNAWGDVVRTASKKQLSHLRETHGNRRR